MPKINRKPLMQNIVNINLDVLVQQIHVLYPHLSLNDKDADLELRRKLCEQLLEKVPEVELEHLDLKCIIMNVKKSLSEFQRRIDESVAQQQLRRTTRVRKPIYQDPAVVNFFNPGQKIDRKVCPLTTVKTDAQPACSNSKCSLQVSELSGLVQVESLPVSASTNLLTIFVPSILQEKLHSCKYKISIDLNRLDLTKQILDLNVGQQVNFNLETEVKEQPMKTIEIETDKIDQDDNECKFTYELKSNIGSDHAVQLVDTPTNSIDENDPKIEIKASPDIVDPPPGLEPAVSIITDTVLPPCPTAKKRGPKRKEPKPPSNDPPKKRGRKPGSKNKKKDEKSELAKYVEMFAANAGSPSAVSQIVTSTTQNWDILPDQSGQIAYLMNGEWTLNAPTNCGPQLVSTTNGTLNLEEATGGGQETYIPFEDFVNFIENPSLDAGNNVIARVLDGSSETAQSNLNSQESDGGLSLCIEIPQAKENEIIDSDQQKPSTSRPSDDKKEQSYNPQNSNIAHSTGNHRKAISNDGVLDLSKEYNISLDADVLDLTQKKAEKEGMCDVGKREPVKTVIFSTSRNMPSLDDTMDGDLFSSTPNRGESLENKIVFSIAPHTSPASSRKSLYSTGDNSMADSAIEVERRSPPTHSGIEVKRTTPPTAVNDKTKAEVIKKGMSLLEIEKDIDDSLLDFDNCLDDDLLSLAPSSCFNSPIEDRFADSKLYNVDSSNAKPSVYADSCNDLSSAPRSHLETNILKIKEEELNPVLKRFKIPRVKPINDGSSKEPSPTKAPVNKIPKPLDLVNTPSPTISTACPGDGPKPLFPNVTSNVTANAASEIVSTREISRMFGSLCYGFLADKCFETTCKFSHQLLELNFMKNSLSFLRAEVLHSAYRFIWRHYKLFKFYFPIFCDEYGRRNMRSKLSTMINDCKIQPNCLPYLRNIYSALIYSGLNKTNACRFILSRVKDRSHVAIDILLEIIIESGPIMFSTAIEQLSYIADYKFRMKDINALATDCLRSGSAELITVLIKCLISVDQTEFVTMRSPELIQLLEMIKQGNIDGL